MRRIVMERWEFDAVKRCMKKMDKIEDENDRIDKALQRRDLSRGARTRLMGASQALLWVLSSSFRAPSKCVPFIHAADWRKRNGK